MNGLLVVDKPSGITSHDVIYRCRRALDERRIGHAGTLDPMATGVLLVGVGRATRLLRFLEDLEKEYVAEVSFGVTTSTQDADGDTLTETDASALDAAEVARALEPFRGEILQVPPMVSAIKVGGERLYKKARRGEEIERTPRAVTVRALDMTAFELGTKPRATLRVVCSKGTYVRALAADIGEVLGVGAHLSALRRTRIGTFDAVSATALDDVSPAAVRSMEETIAGYPRRTVTSDEARALIQGRALRTSGIEGAYAVFDPEGLVAMAQDQGGEARSLCVVAER